MTTTIKESSKTAARSKLPQFIFRPSPCKDDFVHVEDCILFSFKDCWKIVEAIESDKDMKKMPKGCIDAIDDIIVRRSFHHPGGLVDAVRLVWYKAMRYNPKGSDTHETARLLSDSFESKLRQLVEA